METGLGRGRGEGWSERQLCGRGWPGEDSPLRKKRWMREGVAGIWGWETEWRGAGVWIWAAGMNGEEGLGLSVLICFLEMQRSWVASDRDRLWTHWVTLGLFVLCT